LPAEIGQIPALRADAEYPLVLPELLRNTLTVGDTALAHRLLDGVEPQTPVAEHALASAGAQLAEAAYRHAQLYHEAAQRRRQFGNVPERAYAPERLPAGVSEHARCQAAASRLRTSGTTSSGCG